MRGNWNQQSSAQRILLRLQLHGRIHKLTRSPLAVLQQSRKIRKRRIFSFKRTIQELQELVWRIFLKYLQRQEWSKWMDQVLWNSAWIRCHWPTSTQATIVPKLVVNPEVIVAKEGLRKRTSLHDLVRPKQPQAREAKQVPQKHDKLPVEQPLKGKQKSQGKTAQLTHVKVEDKRRIPPFTEYQRRQQDLQQNIAALDQDPKQEEQPLQEKRTLPRHSLHRKTSPITRAALASERMMPFTFSDCHNWFCCWSTKIIVIMSKKDESVKFKILLIGPSGTHPLIQELARPRFSSSTSRINFHTTIKSPQALSSSPKRYRSTKRPQSTCRYGIQYV